MSKKLALTYAGAAVTGAGSGLYSLIKKEPFNFE